ncbi:MAG: hypothetical protein SRB2_00497 [Desulfobacteraceae bacterium Eth-SRB2]|nr:MAG: hypothetical protein SRB2_00497 [Desulfobacteraceae bacterium Eth-SRB2]
MRQPMDIGQNINISIILHAAFTMTLNRELYFYLEGANWRISASLPHAVQLGLGGYVGIEMDEDKPYINYEEHKRKYPPGQFKKRDKRKNK